MVSPLPLAKNHIHHQEEKLGQNIISRFFLDQQKQQELKAQQKYMQR